MKLNLHLVALGLLAMGVTTLAPRAAHALPTALGAFPSTDISTKGNFRNDIAAYTSTNLDTTVLPTQGIEYGAGPDKNGLFGRTEFGYDYNFTSAAKINFGKRLFGNVKTQLYSDDKQQVRVVAGGWLLGDSQTSPNYVYLLASKNFNKFGRVHVGYAYAISDGLFNTTNSTTNVTTSQGRSSLHLGYDRLITPKLQFVTDYYSGKGPFAGIQPTLYYSVTEKASFGLGYFRATSKAVSPRNQLYISFAYNFDFNKAAPEPANSNPAPSNGNDAAQSGTTGATNGGPAPVPPTP